MLRGSSSDNGDFVFQTDGKRMSLIRPKLHKRSKDKRNLENAGLLIIVSYISYNHLYHHHHTKQIKHMMRYLISNVESEVNNNLPSYKHPKKLIEETQALEFQHETTKSGKH